MIIALPTIDPDLTPRPIDASVRMGHVHSKLLTSTARLTSTAACGFELKQRYGSEPPCLGGGYHHHIGLNTGKPGRSPSPRGTTGLFHIAILYPTRAALADALKRLIAAKVELDRASDHGVSEALYLRDPDGNGVELYRDRPEAEWPRNADGTLAMTTRGARSSRIAGRSRLTTIDAR